MISSKKDTIHHDNEIKDAAFISDPLLLVTLDQGEGELRIYDENAKFLRKIGPS